MIKFDNGWVVRDDYLQRLENQGYTVAAYMHKDHRYYVLYNLSGTHVEIVYETDDPDELSNYVKLLIGGRDGGD